MTDNTKKAHDAADALCEALWPALEEYTSEKGVAALTALAALAKPYLRSALSRVKGVDHGRDGRTQSYHLSAMVWELDEDDPDEAEMILSTDDEGESKVCYGLTACLEQLVLWLLEFHDGEELSDEVNMTMAVKRTPSLRVSLARGNGVGEFRLKYTADGDPMLAHATVRRLEDDEDE